MESDGQAAVMVPNAERSKALDDEEAHVDPNDPDVTDAGDVHVVANTCL